MPTQVVVAAACGAVDPSDRYDQSDHYDQSDPGLLSLLVGNAPLSSARVRRSLNSSRLADRFDAHAWRFFTSDGRPRHLEDQIVRISVVELIAGEPHRVALSLRRSAYIVFSFDLRVQRADQRVRVEEQLQDRLQQTSDGAQRRRVCESNSVVSSNAYEGSCGASSGGCSLLEPVEQIRPHAARIEELLQLGLGQLADLLFGRNPRRASRGCARGSGP